MKGDPNQNYEERGNTLHSLNMDNKNQKENQITLGEHTNPSNQVVNPPFTTNPPSMCVNDSNNVEIQKAQKAVAVGEAFAKAPMIIFSNRGA